VHGQPKQQAAALARTLPLICWQLYDSIEKTFISARCNLYLHKNSVKLTTRTELFIYVEKSSGKIELVEVQEVNKHDY